MSFWFVWIHFERRLHLIIVQTHEKISENDFRCEKLEQNKKANYKAIISLILSISGRPLASKTKVKKKENGLKIANQSLINCFYRKRNTYP